MKSIRLPLLILALVALVATTILPAIAAAQDLHPSRQPSPMGMARTTLDDGTYVRFVYSRPYLRGRDNIFGTEESEALVPFGNIWRFGANAATEITVTGDVMIGGEKLPAGTYSVFATPNEKAWIFHFNTALGLSGTFGRNAETGQFEMAYKAENDAATVKAKVGPLTGEDTEEVVDQFTLSFEDGEDGTHLVVRWQKTELRLPVSPAS